MLRMLRIESKKNVLKAVTPLIILLIIIAILSRNRYLTYVAILGAINAIAVLGLNLISGYTGQLHLGQAGFLGVGAYASSILILRMGMPYWLSFLCGIAISALFGALLGIPALRLRRGPYLALVTQTFNALVCTILLNWESLTGGPFGLSGIKKPHIGKWRIASLQSYLILTCVLLVLAYVAMRRIVASKYGQVFQAIRESEDAAQAVGILSLIHIFIPNLPMPSVQEFVKEFKEREKTDMDPPQNVARAYDATKLLLNAIERAGITDKEAIRQALRTTTDLSLIHILNRLLV